jgi:hypothetical protein
MPARKAMSFRIGPFQRKLNLNHRACRIFLQDRSEVRSKFGTEKLKFHYQILGRGLVNAQP